MKTLMVTIETEMPRTKKKKKKKESHTATNPTGEVGREEDHAFTLTKKKKKVHSRQK